MHRQIFKQLCIQSSTYKTADIFQTEVYFSNSKCFYAFLQGLAQVLNPFHMSDNYSLSRRLCEEKKKKATVKPFLKLLVTVDLEIVFWKIFNTKKKA